MNVLGNEVNLLPEIKVKAIALMQDNPTKMCTGRLHSGGCYCVLGWIAKATQDVLGVGKFVGDSSRDGYQSHWAFTIDGTHDSEEYGSQGTCLLSEKVQRMIFTGLPGEFETRQSPCLEISRIGDSKTRSLEEKIQWIDANL